MALSKSVQDKIAKAVEEKKTGQKATGSSSVALSDSVKSRIQQAVQEKNDKWNQSWSQQLQSRFDKGLQQAKTQTTVQQVDMYSTTGQKPTVSAADAEDSRGTGFSSRTGGFGSGKSMFFSDEELKQIQQETVMERAQEAAERYREDPTKYRLEAASEAISDAAKKLQEADEKVKTVEAQGQALSERLRGINQSYTALQGLLAQYQKTGSDVDGKAYILASQQHEATRAQYNQDVAQWEKDAGVYDQYKSALEAARKAQTNYTAVRDDYLNEHPAEKYQDAGLLEIYGVMQGLRAEIDADYEKAYANGTYKKWEDLNALYKQKALEQDNGLWNSSPVDFMDKALSATQAGMHDWLAGVEGLKEKASELIVSGASKVVRGVAEMSGNETLKQIAADAEERVKVDKSTSEAEQQASLEYMQEALMGTGKIDGWIIQQMESVGAMWMDTMFSGMSGGKISSLQILGTRAAGSAMLDAQEKGYSETEQLFYGAAVGALEVVSEKLFGGNPLYDTDKGLVNQLVEKVTKNPAILRLMYSKGFEIMGEGLEEVFTEFTEPVAEWLWTDSADVDWASPEEIAQAFAGGVFLGLTGQGVDMAVNAAANRELRATQRAAGIEIIQMEAAQEVVAEGLQADKTTDAYLNAWKLQKKLDAGKTLSAREIGKQLMDNQAAMEAGKLVGAETAPVQEAPEGALKDPVSGFYGILMENGEDGKTTFRLVEVAPDGSMTFRSNTTTDNLLCAKITAEIQGLNIRDIGTAASLRARAAQMEEAYRKGADPERAKAFRAGAFQEEFAEKYGSGVRSSMEAEMSRKLGREPKRYKTRKNAEAEEGAQGSSRRDKQETIDAVREKWASFVEQNGGLPTMDTYHSFVSTLSKEELDALNSWSENGQTQSVEEEVWAERIATAPAEPRNDSAEMKMPTETEGIQWAGNMPENLNGGTDYGTEQSEKAKSDMGDGGNQVRTGGYDAGTVGESEQSKKRKRAQDTIRRAEEARRVQANVEAAGGELTSLRDVGLKNGSRERNVRIVPENAWTDGIREAADIAEQEGVTFVPLSGMMYVQHGNGEERVNGVYENGTIYVQADSTRMNAVEITMHEAFHARADRDPTLVPRLCKLLEERYSDEQLDTVFQRYYETYQDVYRDSASDEELDELIWEEMLADAYAEFQRFLGADASQFGMDVQEAVWNQGKEESTAENVRFSLEGHEDDLQDILDQGTQQAATMEPVREMDGTEFAKGEMPLEDQVAEYFASIGNRAEHPILGEVILNRRGAKDDLSHGIGRKKATTFLAIPDVIAKGGLIDYQENWKGRDYDTAVIAAPVIIAGDRYMMGVVLKRTNRGNAFYVHEVLAESEEGATPFKTGAVKNGLTGGDTPSVLSLLQKVMNVKRGNVRYSLGGEPVRPREKGLRNESRFSLSSPVEQTDTLIALHNMTEEKLKRTLELGSWPAPSIAIVRAEQGHENFGEYSAVFPRSTIDPEADTRNKVYGSDAWTPTHNNAQVEYEVNYDAKRAFENKIYDLSSKFAGGAFQNSSVIGGTGVGNETNMSLDEIAQRLAKNPAVQAAYLQNRGDTLEPVYKAKNFDSFGNEALQRYIDSIGYQELARQDMELTLGNELSEDIMEAARNIIIDEWVSKNEWRLKNKPELREKRIENQRKKLEDWRVESFIQHAWEYYEKYGETTDEIDTSATGAAMFDMIMPDGSWEEIEKVVKDWVRPQLEGMLGEPGIYNGKDRITNDGRRSFRETHYSYSAENIVRAMYKLGNTRGDGLWGASAEGMVSVATPEYGSVEDIHADEGRLRTASKDEYDSMMRKLDAEISGFIADSMKAMKAHSDNRYEEENIIGYVLLQAAGSKTIRDVQRIFRKEGYNLPHELAKNAMNIFQMAADIPTKYFEAKPQRVVAFEEAVAVLAPNDAPVGLIDQMREAGINVVIYQAGDEKSRLDSINRLDGVRFSVDSMDTKQTKEDKARARAERELAKGLGEIMSMPQSTVRELQEGTVRQLMEEYQQTGEIDQEMLDTAISEAFAKGLMIDDEFYQQYKPVKDYLRSQALTISEQDRADIADFTDFRKRAFGTLRIVNNGGLPVDAAYQELQGMAPELFPMDITHQADQLVHMYEVCQEIKKVQVPLERAMGENADEFYTWAEKKMNDLVERTLEKYAKSVDWKPKEQKPKEQKRQEISQAALERFEQADREEVPVLQWAGQEKMEGFTQQEQQAETTQEAPQTLEQAANGTMRDWIQYVLSGKMTPEEFAEMNRNAKSRELTGRAKEEAEKIMSGKSILNSVKRDEMTDEEVAALIKQFETHRENAADRNAQTVTPVDELIIRKADFTGTPAMEKLGIKIDGSVTRYRQTKQLQNYEDAAYQAAKMLNKRIRKLKATEQEKKLAQLIVEGTITADALDSSQVDVETVAELADYFMAANSFKLDMIAQRRAEINTMNYRIASDLFRDSDAYSPQLPGVLKGMTKIIMNERTPERVVKQIFGQEQGGKIYETYFRPVWVNGAEMSRFESRMLDRVREFQDKDGKTRALTVQEREFAQRLMEGQAAREAVENLEDEAKEKVTAVAQNLNNGADFTDQIREWGMAGDEYLQGLAQAYADYLDTVTMSKDMDQTILKNAIETYSQIYNELYEAVNDFLTSHGYKPIGFIKGYAPHFQKREVQQGLFGALKSLGVEKESVSELPASIAGRTADFKPNMKWNPHFQSRKGEKTSYDIEAGYEQYIHYVAEMFYHTDDVMRIRQAVNYFRQAYSSEDISQAIEDAKVDQFKDVAWKKDFLEQKELLRPGVSLDDRAINAAYEQYVSDLFDQAKPENLTKYSEFVTWMDNYANIVAGKQSMADRGIEYGGGRNALNMGSKLMRRFASANVAGNLSSVLNQTAQVPLIQQQLGKYMERAMWDMARGTTAKENFAERSDFLTDKRGVEKLTTDNAEKFISTLFKPAEMMDRMVSTLAVRGRYLQALDQGMTMEQAMKEADDFGRRVMGSRMKGAKPLAYESKTFINQMIHVFQVEASNTFDYMALSDMPQAVKQVYKTKGKAAGTRYLAAYIVGYLLNAFLLNQLTDKLYGGTPAPFDLMGWALNIVAGGWGLTDEEFLKTMTDNGLERIMGERPFGTEPIDRESGFSWAGSLLDLGYNVSNDLPYVRNVAGVLGLGDQSLPTVGINEFFKSLRDAGSAVWDQVFKGQEETGLTWAGTMERVVEDLLEAGAQIAPGGRQLKKTAQGVKTMVQGGVTSGYGDNQRLKYPVEQNVWNWARGILYGNAALDEYDAYYASGNQPLTAGQTKKVKELEELGIDKFAAYEAVQQLRKINGQEDWNELEKRTAKRDAINDLDATDEDKYQIYRSLELNSNEEEPKLYDRAAKIMLDGSMTWEDITDALNAYDRINNGMELAGAEKSNAILDLVNSLDLDDDGKQDFARAIGKLTETREEGVELMQEAGMDWNAITEAWKQYNLLNEDPDKDDPDYEEMRLSDTEKATELAKWLDGKNWSKEQKEAVKDAFTFFSQIPAEATNYERFTGVGVSEDSAYELTNILAALEPEDGKNSVSSLQKYRAIVSSSISEQEQEAAIASLMQDSQKETFEDLMDKGMTPGQYVEYKTETAGLTSDKDEDGKTIPGSKKEKVLAAIDAMNISDSLKTALYFAEGYSESTLDEAPWYNGLSWAGS